MEKSLFVFFSPIFLENGADRLKTTTLIIFSTRIEDYILTTEQELTTYM